MHKCLTQQFLSSTSEVDQTIYHSFGKTINLDKYTTPNEFDITCFLNSTIHQFLFQNLFYLSALYASPFIFTF
jgi:hypothetical protein